ncbi:MAG: glycosyltransferase [Flavobacterium sp.]|nr:MAG: glycosyltransferase [Flavobacterium sp.]
MPVISTKAGGIPEVIEHQKNGYLVEIGDYESLAKGLEEYFYNSDKLNQYTEISYNLFHSKFTSKQTAIETLKLYKEILK